MQLNKFLRRLNITARENIYLFFVYFIAGSDIYLFLTF